MVSLHSMRTYELTLVLKPDFKADKKSIEETVKIHCGNDVVVSSFEIWGKKRLAYEIDKFTEGVYVLCKLEAKSIIVSSIEKQMRLGSPIIRYLLTIAK